MIDMGMGMGMQLWEKWECECSVAIEMGGNANGYDFMGMGGNWNPKSSYRTPLTWRSSPGHSGMMQLSKQTIR